MGLSLKGLAPLFDLLFWRSDEGVDMNEFVKGKTYHAVYLERLCLIMLLSWLKNSIRCRDMETIE